MTQNIAVGDWVRTKWATKAMLVVSTNGEHPFTIVTQGESGTTYVWRPRELIKTETPLEAP